MARPAASVQRALTAVATVRDDVDLEELKKLLCEERRDCLRGVTQLHYLSWFVIEREVPGAEGATSVDGTPPKLVLEASFDGRRAAFLEALSTDAAVAVLLDRIYANCQDYPLNPTAQQRAAYLEDCNEKPQLFYVGCPGHSVGQIEEEAKLAARIEEEVAQLREPRGRRFAHIRRLWSALREGEREQVVNAPHKQFWVEYVLRRNWRRGLLVLFGLPLGLWGLRDLALVAMHACGIAVSAPPPEVMEVAYTAWWVLCYVLGGLLLAWLVMLLVEYPKDLGVRMGWRVLFGQLLGIGLATLYALPAFALILGFIVLLEWHGELLLRILQGAALSIVFLAGAFAVVQVVLSLAADRGLKEDPRAREGRIMNLFIAGIGIIGAGAVLVGFVSLLAWYQGAILELYGYPIVAAVAVVGSIVVGLVLVGQMELGDRVDPMRWDADKLKKVCEHEDLGAQNHFVSVTSIKPGPLRILTLRIVLRLTHWLAIILYDPRGLAGIPSIHFARWQILKGERRLLFVTNYDGGWGGYLGDFVALAGWGITAIWGSTGGFPRPFYVFGDGVDDEQRFKCYARTSQLETLFWYRRYPDLSVAAIKRNAAIRDDLARYAEAFKLDAGAITEAPQTRLARFFKAHPVPIAEADLDTFLRRFWAPR